MNGGRLIMSPFHEALGLRCSREVSVHRNLSRCISNVSDIKGFGVQKYEIDWRCEALLSGVSSHRGVREIATRILYPLFC
uniref:Uncharacterized protein n=1 Tax=Pararge aegeria TaxID=116150 RepID=S4NM09_9NEOP